jgi:hypothetical protein
MLKNYETAREARWFGSNKPLPGVKATGDLLQSSLLGAKAFENA